MDLSGRGPGPIGRRRVSDTAPGPWSIRRNECYLRNVEAGCFIARIERSQAR